MSDGFHIPVLSHEAVELLLNPAIKNRLFIDGTLGAGGYSLLLCNRMNSEDRILAIDKDLFAIEEARRNLKPCEDRVEIVNANFADLGRVLEDRNIAEISGITLDLGLSSFQLEHEDGFSYMRDTKLDMRAFKKDSLTAEEVLNSYDAGELKRVFHEYGEIGNPGRLVSAVVSARRKKRFETTFDLINAVEDEYSLNRRNRIDFLSKIFQSLRIEVNNELENLNLALQLTLKLLCGGGRVVIVSYHSLEDRMVKNFFREHKPAKHEERPGRYLMTLTKKPVTPGREELNRNRRSRSAKLRAAELIIK